MSLAGAECESPSLSISWLTFSLKKGHKSNTILLVKTYIQHQHGGGGAGD